MTRRNRFGTGLALALALVVGACDGAAPSAAPPETGDQAAARVGEATVWVSDVRREAVAQGLISEGEPLEVSSDLFAQVLRSVIDQKLLAAEARRRGLDKDAATKHRVAMAQDRILGDILVEASVQKAVTDGAVQALYEETRVATSSDEEFRARQIVTASEADAEAVKGLIAAGATFESLVLTRSVDANTRFSEGDLGYFTLDTMPEAYGAALKDARPGALVGPFPIEGGWVLLKVEDRRVEAPLTLEAARPQIYKLLTYAEVRDLLETLRAAAKVEILTPAAADSAAQAGAPPPAAPGALPTQAPAAKTK